MVAKWLHPSWAAMGKGLAMNASNMFSKIAMGWIVLGLIGLSFVGLFAISHYVFGVPIHEGHSGKRIFTPTEVATTLTALGGGFFLFASLGAVVLLWLRKH